MLIKKITRIAISGGHGPSRDRPVRRSSSGKMLTQI